MKKGLEKLSVPYFKLIQRLLFATMQQKGLSLEELREHISEHIDEIDAVRERLEIDSNHRPLKLLGLTCSYELMNQIYTMIATVGLGVI